MITFKSRVDTIKTGQTTGGLTAISPKIKFIIRKERERERERRGRTRKGQVGVEAISFLGDNANVGRHVVVVVVGNDDSVWNQEVQNSR